MKILLVILMLQRYYWPTPIDTLWVGHQKHTHAAVTGRVRYCRSEDDGDKHIKLVALSDTAKFVVAEIIPLIPLPCPRAGAIITVQGITRLDTEHHFREIHPVETWFYAP